MIAADGSVKWVWERDTIVRDDDGRPIQTEGVMVDITERKLAEARAQHYLDVAGTILLVLRTDQTVELLNRHGRELLGYEDGELLGKDWYDAVVPEDDRPARRDNFIRSAAPAATSRSPTTRATSITRDRRAPHDRLAQHAAARHRGRGHGHPRLGRGHHRAPARGGGDLPPRLLRPADRPAQPRPAGGRAAPLRQPLRPRGPRGRAAAGRPRQLQARQRLLRPRRRRPAAAADRRPAAGHRGQRACSRGSAATSS